MCFCLQLYSSQYEVNSFLKGQILWDTGWLESHLDLRFDMEITNRYFLYYSYLLSEAQLIAPCVKIRDARKPVCKRLQTKRLTKMHTGQETDLIDNLLWIIQFEMSL